MVSVKSVRQHARDCPSLTVLSGPTSRGGVGSARRGTAGKRPSRAEICRASCPVEIFRLLFADVKSFAMTPRERLFKAKRA